MTELLHLENKISAQRTAEEAAKKLHEILSNPILSVEASMYGSELSNVCR